jgi:hypothetical protein
MTFAVWRKGERMRLIDADALIEDVRKNSVSYFADDFAREWVDKQPTIEPRKKGKWRKKYYGLPEIVCSECGHESKDKWFFCPCCGADMRGEHDG